MDQETQIGLHDAESMFLDLALQRAESGLPYAGSREWRKESREGDKSLQEAFREVNEFCQAFQAEVASLRLAFVGEKESVKELWRLNHMPLIEFDVNLTNKVDEIARLKEQL